MTTYIAKIQVKQVPDTEKFTTTFFIEDKSTHQVQLYTPDANEWDTSDLDAMHAALLYRFPDLDWPETP